MLEHTADTKTILPADSLRREGEYNLVKNVKEAALLAEKFRPGGILSGQTFTLDDQFLGYKNAYGKYATVPRRSIQTVVIDAKGRGQSVLKLIGQGTELASLQMPHPWATKTQRWLMGQLGL